MMRRAGRVVSRDDLIEAAWGIEIAGVERPFRHLASVMKQVIPSSWIVWDEEKLRGEFVKSAVR